jgi:hypothetical protein
MKSQAQHAALIESFVQFDETVAQIHEESLAQAVLRQNMDRPDLIAEQHSSGAVADRDQDGGGDEPFRDRLEGDAGGGIRGVCLES